FLRLLPDRLGALRLRHAIEVRHPSFRSAEYVELVRRHGVATVFADSDDYTSFADSSADFVYARLMRCEASCTTGYPPEAIAAWAERARTWSTGAEPSDVARLTPPLPAAAPRDVFLFFIGGAKERAPAAAVALRAQIEGTSPPR
ncbi:MAG TPA: DUF72 domain-containing protein, partial [Caldimonas sp.]